MCPARTPSGGVRDLWVYVCLCYSIIRKGSATRIRVPLSSFLGGIFGRVCELVTRLGTRATRGNMAALGGDLFVLGIGEGGKGACDNICAWFLPRENVVQGVDDIVFSSGIRWPRLAAHDREEERGSLSASRATGGPLRVRSARSGGGGGGGQNGCCLPSGGVGTACDGLDLPSRFEGCRADGIVHSIQERSRSPRPRTLGDRGKGSDSPCPMDGGILGRRVMEEKDASAVALAWTCWSCRPYSSRSLTGRLPSGWGVAVAVTVTMAVGELGRDGVVGGSSSSAVGAM